MEEKDLILKKDTRILFNKNSKGEITEMIVAEFTKENNPKHLYEKYTSDLGNCLSYWNTWSNAFILFKIFVNCEFVNREVKSKAWDEMMKIKELREDVSKASSMYMDANGNWIFRTQQKKQ